MKSLTSLQKRTLDFVVKSGLTKGFYLAGGTAIAIRYSHRFSEDFDFFAIKFPPSFWSELNKLIDRAREKRWKIQDEFIDQKTTAIFRINSVKFSFFEYPYKLVRPLDRRYFPLEIASDEDIVAMKAVAIIQRGNKKDFFDMYFLLQQRKWMLEDVIEICREKYGNIFSKNLFLKALLHFEDAEKKQSYPEIEEKWEEIKDYFRKALNEYFERAINGNDPTDHFSFSP